MPAQVRRCAVGLGALAASLVMAGTSGAQERHQVSGQHVAVYDLVGHVSLQPGGGSAVLVEVTRNGADASRLQIAQGQIGDRETLRVLYPSDDIRDPDGEFRGRTDLRVRDDGTFGDHGEAERRGEGHRVRISDRGDFEASADLVISVPAEQRIDVYLAVGKLSATNVHGTIRLDAAGADVTGSGLVGPLVVDVGSGDVRLRDVQGEVSVRTGSGDVDASGVRGDRLCIDTGSGGATVTGAQSRLIDLSTGSGDLEVSGGAATEVKLDTGSGSVRCELTTSPGHLDVDTGSGDVTLTLPPTYSATVDIDTGSGGIDVDFPVTARKVSRDHLTGQIGDGRGTLRIETGSGGIHLHKGTAG